MTYRGDPNALGMPSICYTRGNKIHITVDSLFTFCRTPVNQGFPAILGDLLAAPERLCKTCQRRFNDYSRQYAMDVLARALGDARARHAEAQDDA